MDDITMAATKSFAQRVYSLRRVKHKKPSLESRAANSASHLAESGTDMWKSLYEAKLLEYRLAEKLSVLNDSADSIRLNQTR